MDAGGASLTGVWSGKHTYARIGRPTACNATIVDQAGSLTGETIEPNTFLDAPTQTLMAGLIGTRDGQDVAFRKTYSDFKSPTLHDEGTATPDLKRSLGFGSLAMAPAPTATL